tara:strand:+ start:1877 stop:2239 length:363 start_codon:yes stop_codon:yes gene_type:complete
MFQMFGKLIAGTLCLIGVHTCVWFSTNLQFVSEKAANNSLAICLALALPTSLLAYYGTQLTYDGLGESVWSIRFLAFGTSYLVFPVLTWLLLKESMLTPKNLVCIALSFLIVGIQVFWKN